MGTEQCFCHFNGYEVKDANARSRLSTIEPKVTTAEGKITTAEGKITTMEGNITTLLTDTALTKKYLGNVIVTVGDGCMYSTINSAITYAKTICSGTKRVVILIASGYYEEEITLNENPGIDFIGLGKVTVAYGSTYPNAPIYTLGNGYFSNITFVNTKTTGNAYAFHYEAQVKPSIVNTECIFENCNFVTFSNAPAGCGMGDGQLLRFIGCGFYNNGANSPGFYAHNLPTATTNTQQIELINCFFNVAGDTCILIDNARAIQGNTGTSNLLLTFNRCTSITSARKVNFRYASDLSKSYIDTTGEIAISSNSVENNIPGVTKDKNIVVYNAYIPTTNQGGNWGRFSFYYPNADAYNWEVLVAYNDADGTTNVTSNTTILGSTTNTVNGQVLASVIGLNATIRGIPK